MSRRSPTACSRCGCRRIRLGRRRRRRRDACADADDATRAPRAGSPPSFPAGRGSPSSSSRAPAIARGSRAARRSRSATGLPQVAAGDVHMHVRARRALQDTLTAIRLGKPLAECGYALYPNGERHLRSRARLATIYPAELLAETRRDRRALHVLARRAALRVSGGDRAAGRDAGVASAQAHRGRTARGGMRQARCPSEVRELIEHELALIAELRYEPYFLTVHDIVAFARSQRHPVPGPRLGGQLGRLLRARHHRSRSRRG